MVSQYGPLAYVSRAVHDAEKTRLQGEVDSVDAALGARLLTDHVRDGLTAKRSRLQAELLVASGKNRALGGALQLELVHRLLRGGALKTSVGSLAQFMHDLQCLEEPDSLLSKFVEMLRRTFAMRPEEARRSLRSAGRSGKVRPYCSVFAWFSDNGVHDRRGSTMACLVAAAAELATTARGQSRLAIRIRSVLEDTLQNMDVHAQDGDGRSSMSLSKYTSHVLWTAVKDDASFWEDVITLNVPPRQLEWSGLTASTWGVALTKAADTSLLLPQFSRGGRQEALHRLGDLHAMLATRAQDGKPLLAAGLLQCALGTGQDSRLRELLIRVISAPRIFSVGCCLPYDGGYLRVHGTNPSDSLSYTARRGVDPACLVQMKVTVVPFQLKRISPDGLRIYHYHPDSSAGLLLACETFVVFLPFRVKMVDDGGRSQVAAIDYNLAGVSLMGPEPKPGQSYKEAGTGTKITPSKLEAEYKMLSYDMARPNGMARLVAALEAAATVGQVCAPSGGAGASGDAAGGRG